MSSSTFLNKSPSLKIIIIHRRDKRGDKQGQRSLILKGKHFPGVQREVGFILKSAAPSAAIAFCFENLESFEKVLDYFAMASVRLHSLCIKSPRARSDEGTSCDGFSQ